MSTGGNRHIKRLPAWHLLTFRGRHLLILDMLVTSLSFVGSFALRFDLVPDLTMFLIRFAWVLPVLLIARAGAFIGVGLYQRVWRYASIAELQAIAMGVGISSAIAYGAAFAAGRWDADLAGLPRSIPLIDSLAVFVLIGGMRFGFLRTRIGRREGGRAAPTRALVVGAGTSGVAVARQVMYESDLGLQIVGFVDDDETRGHKIMGIPILGATADLTDLIQRHGVGTVLFALPAAPGRALKAMVRAAEDQGARCLTVPSMSEILAGHVTPTVRNIEVDDLLRRAPARIHLDSVAQVLEHRTVLITGAGGSVGSELSRQVLRLRPRHLYLIGRGEHSIYEVVEAIRPLAKTTELHPVILDVRDGRGVDKVIGLARPDIVFHAAAHKHVFFMERQPDEAVSTNVLGTDNVLAACEANGVPSFVLVSTDKAVRPANVMGATKRVAELLTRDAAMRTGGRYVTVRFGNVLSSRGSVLPRFRRQLAAGGPLTVSHPDVMRFFMTTGEAVQLILQAAAIGHGGETLVLDMGEPVKIDDLARDLIRLHGYKVGSDIEVIYTGLSAGEKLTEELFLPDEVRQATSHESLWIAADPSARRVDRVGIGPLKLAAERHDVAAVVAELRRLVPEYAGGQEAVRVANPTGGQIAVVRAATPG